jgi:nucleoside-diphosphate-sugar epimerase
MGNVLVTGGSGFLGQHLIRELVARGHAVRALARSGAADAAIAALGATPQRGDLDEPGSLDAAFAPRVDAVFHTAADTNTWTPRNARQTRTNVDGTRALVAAAERAQAGAFIHTSSIASFSHLTPGTLREDSPRRGGASWINYERDKFHAEESVRAAMARGLNAIVLYPAHIFGPGDTRNWAKLIQLIDRRKLPGAPPGSGAFADVREIAKAQVRAWERRRFGEGYLLGGEHDTFVGLINRIGRLLGRAVPARATPAWVLRPYARGVDLVSRLTRREPEITPEAAMFTCHHLAVDSSKAQRELDYAITPLDALLSDTVAWMREAGMLSG